MSVENAPANAKEAAWVPLGVRFITKVSVVPNDCWEWLASKTPAGYGKIGAGGKRGETLLAHRVAYELFIGPIPDGLQLDHLCRNRGCVNPAHLEPVTCRENLMRGEGPTAKNARKTHCLRGHLLEGSNLYVDRRGLRCCRACSADHSLRRYYRLKGAST